jgi:hypothetical protein
MPDVMPLILRYTIHRGSDDFDDPLRNEGSMNQNDMDRYFWRTGQAWSGDQRKSRTPPAKSNGLSRGILFVLAVLGAATAIVFFQR